MSQRTDSAGLDNDIAGQLTSGKLSLAPTRIGISKWAWPLNSSDKISRGEFKPIELGIFGWSDQEICKRTN